MFTIKRRPGESISDLCYKINKQGGWPTQYRYLIEKLNSADCTFSEFRKDDKEHTTIMVDDDFYLYMLSGDKLLEIRKYYFNEFKEMVNKLI